MSPSRPNLVAALVYRDPRAAISWLERAFGFEVIMLIEGQAGGLAHCEMRLGDGVIMVGAEWTEDHKSPQSLGGKVTQTLHIQIDTDIDNHVAGARAAGAVILMEPETQFYGDRTYRCRDLEGHIWTVAQTVVAVTREEAEATTGFKITGWV